MHHKHGGSRQARPGRRSSDAVPTAASVRSGGCRWLAAAAGALANPADPAALPSVGCSSRCRAACSAAPLTCSRSAARSRAPGRPAASAGHRASREGRGVLKEGRRGGPSVPAHLLAVDAVLPNGRRKAHARLELTRTRLVRALLLHGSVPGLIQAAHLQRRGRGEMSGGSVAAAVASCRRMQCPRPPTQPCKQPLLTTPVPVCCGPDVLCAVPLASCADAFASWACTWRGSECSRRRCDAEDVRRCARQAADGAGRLDACTSSHKLSSAPRLCLTFLSVRVSTKGHSRAPGKVPAPSALPPCCRLPHTCPSPRRRRLPCPATLTAPVAVRSAGCHSRRPLADVSPHAHRSPFPRRSLDRPAADMATSTGRDGGIPGSGGPAGTAAHKEEEQASELGRLLPPLRFGTQPSCHRRSAAVSRPPLPPFPLRTA